MLTNTTSLCCSDEMSIQKHWKIRLTYLCHNLLQYYSHNLSKTCLCLVSYVHSLSKTCCLPSACQQRWREWRKHVHCTHDAFPESSIQSLTTITCCFRLRVELRIRREFPNLELIFSNWKWCFRIQGGVLKLGVKVWNSEWSFRIWSEDFEFGVSF